jgi:hypothetical protein
MDLQRMKIIGYINQEISFTRIVINPNQTNLITVMSDKFIKNYKVKEESISIQPDI